MLTGLLFGEWSASMCDTFDCTARHSIAVLERLHPQVPSASTAITSSTCAAFTGRPERRSIATSELTVHGAARPASIASAQRSSIAVAGTASGRSGSRTVAVHPKRCLII